MLDVEISLRLAFAIGWPYDKVHIVKGVVQVPSRSQTRATRPFNYLDPHVIWAVAEKYDAFPMKSITKDRIKGNWCALMGSNQNLVRYADTAKKAVALCVIAHDEYQKRQQRKKAGVDQYADSFPQLSIAAIKSTF
jgi:hypothetical protein